jgi:hypothetical protein
LSGVFASIQQQLFAVGRVQSSQHLCFRMTEDFAMSGRIGFIVCVLILIAGFTACGGNGSPVGNGPGLGGGSNNALLNGQYAFSFSGQRTSGSLFAAVGSFTADGAGHLTGTMDVNGTTNTVNFGGPYSLDTDGRGNVVLGITPGCPNWQFTMVSHRHGLLTCLNSTVTASGTIDLQDTTAFRSAKLKGNYVFGLSGLGLSTSTSSGGLVVIAGDWTMDGNGKITRGEMDVNDISGVVQDIPLSGTYSVAANGRGTAILSSSYASPQNFVFYVVNATDLKFVETDSQPIVSGEVLSQAAGPFSPASLNGGHAFVLGGSDSSGNPISLGGVFTADGAGKTPSGFVDINDAGVTSLGGSLSGNYAVNATGRGLLTLTTPALQLAFYKAASGTIELVDVDGSLGAMGTAMAQTGGPFHLGSISGRYAVNFSGTNLSSFGEEDITGQLVADGTGNLSGTLDINNLGSIFQGVGISSSTYSMNSDGRGFATINASVGSFSMQTYQANPNTVFFQDVDNNRVVTGVIQKQQF